MSERKLNAKSVKKLGLGEYIDPGCNAKDLRDISIKVMNDAKIP